MKFLILSAFLSISSAFSQHDHSGHSKNDAKRVQLSSEIQSEVSGVLLKNDELFNALLKKDNALVENKALELSELIKKSSSKALTSLKVQAEGLKTIKKNNSPEKNLEAYDKFLKPLIDIVKQYDVGPKFNVYYCPMVKKSWIQSIDTNKEVKNVFAMDMLECGTQETKF